MFLQPAPGSSTSIASAYFVTATQSLSISLALNDGYAHREALYLLDFTDNGRAETISISNAIGAPLDTESLSNFDNGVYAIWKVSGSVTITIDRTSSASGDNPF